MRVALIIVSLGAGVFGEECWFNPCTQADLESKKLIEVVADSSIDTIEKCQGECKKKANDADDTKKCKWFDFYTLHGDAATCTLLNAECEHREAVDSKAHSGPPVCADAPVCPKPSSKTKVEWDCWPNEFGSLVFGENSECTTKCHGETFTSTCEKETDPTTNEDTFTWGDVQSSGDKDENIKTPDKEGDCKCPEIDIGKTDPNLEPGAIFHVTQDDIEFCNKKETKISEGLVYLQCDGHIATNIRCLKGAWRNLEDKNAVLTKDEIKSLKDDLWCFDKESSKCPDSPSQ